MNIVYAAEKQTIAGVLGDHLERPVDPDDIEVTENPGQTGSFYVGWHRRRFLMSPAGRITSAWSRDD